MSNKLAKAIKHKTDAMLRLQGQTQKPVVVEAVDGSFSAPDKEDYTAALVAGKNIQILVSGNKKTIHAVMGLLEGSNISVSAPDPITGKVTISGTISGKGINITDFAGKNGYVLAYNSTSDKFELVLSAGSYTLPLATETMLGGIKAKVKTTESVEAAIDPSTGKIFVPSGGGSSTAADVSITDSGGYFAAGNVEGALSELFTSVSSGKVLIADAITDKGVATSASDSFSDMATNISSISSGGTSGFAIGWNIASYSQVTESTIPKPS